MKRINAKRTWQKYKDLKAREKEINRQFKRSTKKESVIYKIKIFTS